MSPITRRLQTAVVPAADRPAPRCLASGRLRRVRGQAPGLGAGIPSREAPRSPEQTDLRFLDSKDIPRFKQGLNYKLKNDRM